jgi:CheY-like chemotaxis protein
MNADSVAVSGLSGQHVLVVEDEFLIAMFLEDLLSAAGCLVMGPMPSIGEALTALAYEPQPDIALLDFHVAGETSVTVADALAGRGVPMVFLTGFGREALPPRYQDRPVLTKPYDAHDLIAALTGALQHRPAVLS